MRRPRPFPSEFIVACRRWAIRLSRTVLFVDVPSQTMDECECAPGGAVRPDARCDRVGRYRISTSRHGVGETRDSHQTPRGLHRIAQKVGGGYPVGTIFKGREPAGLTWKDDPNAAIAHRILWLAGMEPGKNLGGKVDTFHRYIYVHGLGKEPTLGRPASIGCVHLAAADLLPLYDRVRVGTLVWIQSG